MSLLRFVTSEGVTKRRRLMAYPSTGCDATP
jgi:hypothetical protein